MAKAEKLIERATQVAADAEASRLREELRDLRSRYTAALKQLDAAKQQTETIRQLQGIRPQKIPTAKRSKSLPDATAILVCSDWHVEERVKPEECRGLNEYTLEVADRRIAQMTRRAARLIEHEKALTNIRRVVVAALGDMITGHIHDDLVEVTQLAPMAATRWAGQRLAGVIDEMTNIAPVLVATSSGNHGRSTQRMRIATENEHSFEQNLYLTMAAAERRKNVTWAVGEGYHNVVDIDGYVVRFHHGHALKYGGGVGGITIPANKAIASWNVAQKADIDIFGHWHQHLYVPYRFVANASLIGHNAYAERIKAEFQPPSQTLVIVDHEHNRITKVLPLFVQ